MDIVEIDDDFDLQNIDINMDTDIDTTLNDKPSVNFGSGIELLMNDKTNNDSKENTKIDLDDINKLEDDLNNLNVEVAKPKENKKKLFGSFNMFDSKKKDGNEIKTVEQSKENLGKSTSNLNETKTWDGYSKINDVPNVKEEPKLSKEDEMKEKFKYLRKLEELLSLIHI